MCIARNSDAGLKAVKLLEEEGIKVGFHQLDVTDQKSIAKFASYLLNSYGGLNILVNNAAIAYKVRILRYFYENFKKYPCSYIHT